MWSLGVAGLVVVFVICVIFLIFAPNEVIFYQHKDYYNISDLRSDLFKNHIIERAVKWENKNNMCRSENMTFETIEVFNGEWIPPFEQRVDLRGVKSITLAKLGPMSVLKPSKDLTQNMRILTPVQVPSENINKCGVWVGGDFRPLDTTVMFDPNNLMSVFNSRKMVATYLIIDMKRPKKIRHVV